MSREYLFRACFIKRASHHQFHLEVSKAGRRVKSFTMNKRESFSCTLSGSCWHEEARIMQTRNMRHSMWWIWKVYLFFLVVSPELDGAEGGGEEVRKERTKMSKAGTEWTFPGHSGPIAEEMFWSSPLVVESEFYFHIRSDHCPFLYLVSHREIWHKYITVLLLF